MSNPAKLPDLPPIILWWQGYTDIVPDELAGRIILGEMSGNRDRRMQLKNKDYASTCTEYN